MLFEVELIISNKPLTYVYPNIIEICFTPNHFLFGRPLLYSSNTTFLIRPVKELIVVENTCHGTNQREQKFRL